LRKLVKLFGYGIGDFGLNIYWKTLSLYLVYWYTTVVGLDPAIAGILFFIGMTWDALSDPIMASVSERVKTRFGTYRPFLLYGSISLGLAFIGLFWIPPFQGPLLIATLIGTCLIFRTCYTIVAIPYATMASRLSYDSVERSDFSGARMFCAFLGLLMVSMFLPPLVEKFTLITGSEKDAFQYAAATGSAVATLAILACFFLTQEKPLPQRTVQHEKVWLGIYRNIKLNRALQILLIIILFNTAAGTCVGLSLVFYIDANQDILASKEIVLTGYAIATLILVPVWTYLIHQIGRKKIWLVVTVIHALTALHLFLFSTVSFFGIPIQITLLGAYSGAYAIIFWAFIPDCVEYGQIQSGYRSEAGVFGSVLVTQKLSGGFMGLFVGFMLSSIGIAENTNFVANSEKITLFLAICPAFFLCLSIIPVLVLPLERSKHSQILNELENKEFDHG
jgi:GPH family glycoside/pentoside/hexuronide:cation symporter